MPTNIEAVGELGETVGTFGEKLILWVRGEVERLRRLFLLGIEKGERLPLACWMMLLNVIAAASVGHILWQNTSG